jgi:hypothetical protein
METINMARQNKLATTVSAFFSEKYFLKWGRLADSSFFIGTKDNY